MIWLQAGTPHHRDLSKAGVSQHILQDQRDVPSATSIKITVGGSWLWTASPSPPSTHQHLMNRVTWGSPPNQPFPPHRLEPSCQGAKV